MSDWFHLCANCGEIHPEEVTFEGNCNICGCCAIPLKAPVEVYAAAPELMEACISALAFVEEIEGLGITNWSGKTKLEEAILKARGE